MPILIDIKDSILFQRGKEEGKEEGKAEEKLEMIISCHKNGLEPNRIAKILNVSFEKVLEIIEDWKNKSQ